MYKLQRMIVLWPHKLQINFFYFCGWIHSYYFIKIIGTILPIQLIIYDKIFLVIRKIKKNASLSFRQQSNKILF